MIEYVIKRDGRKEPFSSEKFNKLTKWSSDITSDGEADVDWSELALDAVKRLYNGCTTDEILQALINACLDKDKEAYFYIAGKLLMSSMYKNLYNDVIPPSLIDHLEDMEDKGVYLNFLDYYSEEEIDYLDSIINHSLDFTLTHSQVNQARNKYLCSNKVTKELYETPQFMFMRVALAVCMFDNEDIRLENVKKVYHYLSKFHLNLPTPMWTNIGTPFKTGTSCLVYTVRDSVGSLTAGDHISNIMTVAGAGIGNTIFTRSKKDPIQNGRLEHLGKIPYFRLLQANIQATMQSGARRGAATTYINCLDPEIRTLIHLRNPTSIEEERVDDIDYAFTFNSVFTGKVKKNEDWMLISYQVAPDLWESMYEKNDQLFEQLFDKYFNDCSVQKTIIKARDLAVEFLSEQRETGRLYEYNSSNSNCHTPFKEKIYGSNLCNEIYLSTKPFNSVLELYKTEYEEGDGYLQTCNLCAINLNKNYTDEEYYDLAYWALRIIDYVIDHSEYKLPQIGVTTKKFRSAGVSFMNLAAHMAKNKQFYNTKEGLQFIHELSERHEYMLMKASLQLSKEYGLAEWIGKTRYPEGWLPLDTYNKNVDKIVQPVYKYDWESLRKDIIANGGIHNCVLSTSVPGESSSLISNSTNSLYPIRQPIVIKTGANSKNVFMAPEYEEYKDYYQIAWDLSDTDMTNVYAVVQKFISQGISCDYYLDHSNPESKSAKKMLKDWLYRDHMGLKGKYYTNNKTSSGKVEEVEIGCGSGGCTL